jgi:predicted transcriptional regulator
MKRPANDGMQLTSGGSMRASRASFMRRLQLISVFGGPKATALQSAIMATSRDRILEALQDLPPDATFDDAIERLVFLAKIDAGLAELDDGKGIPHEEVKQRLRM